MNKNDDKVLQLSTKRKRQEPLRDDDRVCAELNAVAASVARELFLRLQGQLGRLSDQNRELERLVGQLRKENALLRGSPQRGRGRRAFRLMVYSFVGALTRTRVRDRRQ